MSELNPYLELYRELSPLPEKTLLALRKKLIWAYAWAIPNEEAIRALAACSPLLEIGAGSGYWAWQLKLAGAKIQAFDLEPHSPPSWTEIHSIDELQWPQHSESTLLLCWPPLNEPMALEALCAFPGDRVAYVGEWRGRTANSEFHDRLESQFVLEQEIELPRWPGFKDSLWIYRRQPATKITPTPDASFARGARGLDETRTD